MNRVSVATVTLAAAGAAVAATAATAAIVPAMAAPGPAAARPAAPLRTVSHATTAVERAQLATGQASLPGLSSADIAAESDGGKYVTVVHCRGVDTPPPIRVGAPGTPLTAFGTGPSAGLLKMLQKPNPYKTVYTCTVSIKVKVAAKPPTPATKAVVAKPSCEIGTGAGTAGTAGGGRGAKGCAKSVTLNTGFGGMATQVAGHHPAG